MSNIERGCYAKCINLSTETEPNLYNANRFRRILENLLYNLLMRVPDYDEISITENMRCAYRIEFINNTQIPCFVRHQQKSWRPWCSHAMCRTGRQPPHTMSTPAVPALFRPTVIRFYALAHRVVLAPLTRFHTQPDGVPGAHTSMYYAQCAVVPGMVLFFEGTLFAPLWVGTAVCRMLGLWTEAQVKGGKCVSLLFRFDSSLVNGG
ncbi:hypothetical protein FOMPIDRAFT_89583 [Fomitopsis schrenkii]|uniref:Uncharacterized protein n=1 Tax=Fomitopsis schrenkii TaxID=2126942 RepID=S8EXX0_FOMSC|nr:hypothetical protein FOMPIDRAFT_89583 [Fomitopsis schrenkii]